MKFIKIQKIFFMGIFFLQESVFYPAEYEQFSSFNEYTVEQPTPIIQLEFSYNLLPDYTTTSLSGLSTTGGSITQGTGMAFISTSGITGAIAVLASKARLSCQPGQGASVIFSTVFDTGVVNSNQYIGIGNAENGFFFGYTGTTFGILHRNSIGDTWISQLNWNGDMLDGSGLSNMLLTGQFGNVYKIQYQPIGFGIIKFFVQNPTDASWILVHTIEYPNSTGEIPSISNFAMQLLAVAANGTTGVSSVTMRVPCMQAAIEGYTGSNDLYARFSTGTVKAGVTSVLENILSIQNNLNYGGLPNQTMVFPDVLAIQNSSTTAVSIQLFINPAVSGASYVNIGGNSAVSFDITGTGTTGGRHIMTDYLVYSTINTEGIEYINLSDQKISLAPGDRLVVAGQSLGGGLGNIGVGLSWVEK
jgi:hypothetical protein